jgi:hypothetical protein
MTGPEYRSTLQQLGLTQAGLGRWLGVHEVTARDWSKRGPPKAVEKWLRYLRARHMTPAEVEAAIAEVMA